MTSSISGLSGTDASYQGQPVTAAEIAKWDKSSTYELNYTYKIQPATKVKNGDTAKVSLPAGTHFHDAQSTELISNDGKKSVVGYFRADQGATFGTITFTNYFATQNNDMGGTLEIPVSGDADSGGDTSGNYIAKAGFAWSGSWEGKGDFPLDANQRYQYAEWDAKINPNNRSLNNVLVTDTLQNTSSQQLIPSDMVLQYADNNQTVPANDYQINYLPSNNPTSFTIKWNGTLSKAVNVLYLVKITDPTYRTTGAKTVINNHIEITGVDQGKGGGISGKIDDTTGGADGHIYLGANGNGNGTVYNLTVHKNWQGVPNGVQTPAIQARLYLNGQKTNTTLTLNIANHYTRTFNGLSEKDSKGNPITYSVAEDAVPKGYTGTTDPQTFDGDHQATLTNKYKPVTPATTSIKVNKSWQGVPTDVVTPPVTVTLYADGKSTGKTLTLTKDHQYTGSFDNLPVKNAAGKEIKYTVAETPVTGYTPSTKGQQAPKNGAVTLVNTFIPKTTVITVKKTWLNVPVNTTTPSITATLYANGKSTGKTVTLDGGNQYTATFGNLPTRDASGKAIVYTVAETKVPDGYRSTTSGPQSVKNGVVTLSNTYIPTTPDTPVIPVTPVNPPDNPVTPPDTPDTPTTPETPNTPDVPDVPDVPSEPSKSTSPKKTTPKSRAKTSHVSEQDQAIPTPKASTDSSAPVASVTGKLPQTGDDSWQGKVMVIVGGLLIGLVGVGMLIQRKIKN